MKEKIFELGAHDMMAKIASNPAAPAKRATGQPTVESPNAPYLQGSPRAGQHVAGSIESRPQPWPGYVNHSKGAPTQTAGAVAQDNSPDIGERGSAKGQETQAVTKSAAFEWGMRDAIANS